jgi:hypothetical protein
MHTKLAPARQSMIGYEPKAPFGPQASAAYFKPNR